MILRLFIALIVTAFGITLAHAQCTPAFPKSTLNAQVQSSFPDNSTGAITPLTMRTFMPNLIESVQQYPGVSFQNGTSYTVQIADYGQLLVFTNGSAIAVTVPAGSTNGFCPFSFFVTALGGDVTITPTLGLISGVPDIVVAGGESVEVRSDGTNWWSVNPTNIVNNGVINNGTGNALAYYVSTGHVLSALAITNNAVVVTDGSGVPSESTTLPSGLTIPGPTFSGTVIGPDGGSWTGAGINGTVVGGVVPADGTFDTLSFTTMTAASLAGSPTTVTGLTINNAVNSSADYVPYYNSGTGTIERATVGSIGSAATAGVSALNGLTGGLVIPQATAATGTTLSLAVPMAGGRLTLQANTPVMTTSQIGVSTLRYDCYNGNVVPYYNGTNVVVDTIGSCEVTDAMQSSSTGVLNASGVFDVWWEGNTHHNICVATNGSGGGWASDAGSNTARGTGYSQLAARTATTPFLTNANTITHCYNGATDYGGSLTAHKLTYLGTFYTTAAGQTSWQYGVNGAPPTQAVFGLWNAFNRVDVSTIFGEGTATWTYNIINTWRQVHNDTTYNVLYVAGLAEDSIDANYSDMVVSSGTPRCYIGIGVDSTTAFSGTTSFNVPAGSAQHLLASYTGVPGVGLHTINAIESIDTAPICTYQGDNNIPIRLQTGINARLRM